MTFTEHPADFDADGPDVLKPATGTGALPASARGVRFAQRAGYQLEQVERFSSLAMPPDPDRAGRPGAGGAGQGGGRTN